MSRVRWSLLVATLGVLAQAALGMAVNLDVGVSSAHPGVRPSNYLAGSYHSIVWAIGHGATALAVHAALGVALVLLAIATVVIAAYHGSRTVIFLTALAALLVIGAGFNGAGFLDYGHDTSSLTMALASFAAIGAYSMALALDGPGIILRRRFVVARQPLTTRKRWPI